MKELSKKDCILLNLLVFFIILLIISVNFIFYEKKVDLAVHIIAINNISKLLLYFLIFLPLEIIYLILKHFYFNTELYFFEFIFHISVYYLYGFPILLLSLLANILFEQSNKLKTFFNILTSLLAIILIDISIFYLNIYGYYLAILILIIYSYVINYFNIPKNIFYRVFLLLFYSIYITSIDFLFINLPKNLYLNYYFYFFLFSFLIIFLIHLLTLYFEKNTKFVKTKFEFLEKVNDLTFYSIINNDKNYFLSNLYKLLCNYIPIDLFFIGITDIKLEKLNIIYAIEKGLEIKPQTINLKNTMSLITLKSKEDFVYFDDIKKLPNTLYARLEGSNINTASFFGIPIKDKYMRNYALVGFEKESKEKFTKENIQLILSIVKNINFILNFENDKRNN